MPQLNKQQLSEFNGQLFRSGIVGMLKGLLVGLISGTYINYKYNRGLNLYFFRTPYKVGYIVTWMFTGIVYSTEIKKNEISHQLAVEEEMKSVLYFQGKRN